MSDRIAFLQRVQNFALCLCVFSLPLQALLIFPGTSWTITKVVGALVVVAVVIEQSLQRKWPFPQIGIESATVIALAVGAASIAGSVMRDASLHALYIYAQYAAICYACAHVAMREHAQQWVPCMLGAAGAISGGGAILAALGWGLTPTVDTIVPGSTVRRICFGMPDANEQAMLLVFALALLVFMPGTKTRRTSSIWVVACIVLICAGLILTMSRTGWVCAVAVFGIRAAMHPRRRVLIPVVALAVVGLMGIALLRPSLLDSVKRRLVESTSGGDRSIASRVLYNTRSLAVAREGGAFGHGLNSVDYVTQSFTDPLGRRVGVTVHNVPLIVWIETGWVGLLAYLWLWSSVIAVLLGAWWIARDPALRLRLEGYCAMAFSYAVFSQTMPFLQRSAIPILLGCALGVATMTMRRITTQTKATALP